jgi:hypothetical protein
MDDVTNTRAHTAEAESVAPRIERATRKRAGGAARLKKRAAKKRSVKKSRRVTLEQRLRLPHISLYARRLLILARFATAPGETPLTLKDIDVLSGFVPGQTHAFVGRVQNPYVDTLFHYARLFGVSPAWFITGLGPKPHVGAVRAAVARAREARALELAKADYIAQNVAATAERLRGMPAEEFEALRRDTDRLKRGG